MIYIFSAMIFYAAAILFITAASRNLNSALSATIVNLVGGIIPLLFSLSLLTKKTFVTHKFGVLMSLLAGVCIAFYAIANVKSYSQNKVGIVGPMVFGGAILISTLLSTLIFKEKITMLEGIGLVILTIGFCVIVYARATTS